MNLLKRIYFYLKMIRFSHSVFALPFAFTAAFLAAGGIPTARQAFFILLAMVGARSAAMGFNRIIDRNIDAKNPRTSKREIPAGTIKTGDALIFSLLSFGVMAFAAFMLNPLCFKLSPLAGAIVILYSYTKRFTSLSHLVLGVAIAGAPLGAWIAVRGSFGAEIIPLGTAVVFWLAGFDVLYALQDLDFDRTYGLYSIPRKFGIARALVLSRIFHSVTWVLFIWNGFIFDCGPVYFIGMVVVGLLLIYEHSLVKKDDLSKLDVAFFNMNGYISIAVCIFTFADLMLR
ncbi:MAG: UbiA-like polyprenyltransferase [bacterium]